MHIGDTTTRLGMVTPRSVIGANIGGGGRLLPPSACGEIIASIAAHQLRRRLLDARIGDAHAGGEQREHELLERHADVLRRPARTSPGWRLTRAAGSRPSAGARRRRPSSASSTDACVPRSSASASASSRPRADIEADREMRRVGGRAHEHGLAGVPAAARTVTNGRHARLCWRATRRRTRRRNAAAEREDGVGVGVFEPLAWMVSAALRRSRSSRRPAAMRRRCTMPPGVSRKR